VCVQVLPTGDNRKPFLPKVVWLTMKALKQDRKLDRNEKHWKKLLKHQTRKSSSPVVQNVTSVCGKFILHACPNEYRFDPFCTETKFHTRLNFITHCVGWGVLKRTHACVVLLTALILAPYKTLSTITSLNIHLHFLLLEVPSSS